MKKIKLLSVIIASSIFATAYADDMAPSKANIRVGSNVNNGSTKSIIPVTKWNTDQDINWYKHNAGNQTSYTFYVQNNSNFCLTNVSGSFDNSQEVKGCKDHKYWNCQNENQYVKPGHTYKFKMAAGGTTAWFMKANYNSASGKCENYDFEKICHRNTHTGAIDDCAAVGIDVTNYYTEHEGAVYGVSGGVVENKLASDLTYAAYWFSPRFYLFYGRNPAYTYVTDTANKVPDSMKPRLYNDKEIAYDSGLIVIE